MSDVPAIAAIAICAQRVARMPLPDHADESRYEAMRAAQQVMQRFADELMELEMPDPSPSLSSP